MGTFKDPAEMNNHLLIKVQVHLSWEQHRLHLVFRVAGAGEAAYLEQDDHDQEHVEAPEGWGEEVAIGIWHIKGRMFFKGPVPDTVTWEEADLGMRQNFRLALKMVRYIFTLACS